ncbi:plasmid replication/partition related protein [Ideonella sp. DXS29W]|uniref:Plasmid replication/partition related protein n=1 Tax=Ideonella lacteola TaxID=2984193 RepID=A0ABU9BKR8_9BURK
MDIVVNEELKAYIDPLTPEEYESLERSLLTEGCRDALVLWGNVLVDGHNRYGICRKHNLPFQTVQNPRFQSIEDVHLWMIDQHLGRRSISDFQRGVLALRKREIVAERRARQSPEAPAPATADPSASVVAVPTPAADPLDTRQAIAKAARISNNQVVLIEKIHKQAAPELVAAVKAGTISINAAAAVATLPAEEQVAAASAGADELKQVAKRVRESKKKSAPATTSAGATHAATDMPTTARTAVELADAGASLPGTAPWETGETSDSINALRERVAILTAENEALRAEVAELKAQLAEA